MKKKHEETYNFIKNYMREYNYPPTVREIAEGLGLKSLSTVYGRLQTMIKKGYLTAPKGFSASRTIMIKGARYVFDGED